MITGRFTKVEIPEVGVEQDVLAKIGFEALNPGALYWSTFLIVDSQGLPLVKMLDKARETFPEGGREKTYNLGKMPDKSNIGISFFLFAHDDAAYDWDWAEYNRWKMGFSVNLTYLGSAYRFISPGAAPPPSEDLKVLRYAILGESQGGSIAFDPPALDYEGHYTKGTVVNLKAVVNPGFRFIKWHGDLNGPVTSLTNSITMSEDHTVRAEFGVPDLKVLKYEILGESQGGSITFDPPALDNEGHYTKGTVVNLRAVVNPGFRFIKWRGEVDNELSTSLTNKVTMDENATVKAEFALAEVEKFYPLEIDITPAGAGYVTTEPAPTDIANHFVNGTVGKFTAGIRVLVTAHPNTGYLFDHWSDEIQGGTSYSNPEFVAGVMDEHRGVKAHFVESGAPPPSLQYPCPYCSQAFASQAELEEHVRDEHPDRPSPEPEPEPKPVPGWLIPAVIAALAALIFIPGKKGK